MPNSARFGRKADPEEPTESKHSGTPPSGAPASVVSTAVAAKQDAHSRHDDAIAFTAPGKKSGGCAVAASPLLLPCAVATPYGLEEKNDGPAYFGDGDGDGGLDAGNDGGGGGGAAVVSESAAYSEAGRGVLLELASRSVDEASRAALASSAAVATAKPACPPGSTNMSASA